MSTVRKVLDIRKNSVRKQLDNLIGFVTEPKGVFETADTAVKNFRDANRRTLEAVGARIPLTSRGEGLRGRLRRRL